jgi:magnesium-transporting ATPase (P-type)
MKYNKPVYGFLMGALLPLAGVLITYAIKYNQFPFREFISALFENKKDAATVLSLSILINLLPFIYCTNKRYDFTARGVLVATMLYAVLIVLLKFVW